MNRLLLNELTIDTAREQISVLFIVFLIIYLSFYLLSQVGGYLRAFGYNYFRFNVDALFQRIFMWKSYRTPQEQFFDPKFMETYYELLSLQESEPQRTCKTDDAIELQEFRFRYLQSDTDALCGVDASFRMEEKLPWLD